MRDHLGTDDVFLDRRQGRNGPRELFVAASDVPDPDAFGERIRERFDERVRVGEARASVSAVGLGLGAAADQWHSASRTHARRAGIEIYRDYSAEHALTCVIEPDKVEPAVELLHERLALAEAS